MSLPATEDFAGAAGNLGGSWTQQRTTRRINRNGSGLGLQDAVDDALDVYAFWNADTFSPDQYSQLLISAFGSAAAGDIEVTLRASGNGDTAFNNYAVYTDGASGAGNTELAKFVNGAGTVLGNFTVTFASGDTIKATAVGQTVSLYKNGALVSSVIDSAISSGSPGIGSYQGTGSTLPTFDNWQGDNIAAVPAPLLSKWSRVGRVMMQPKVQTVSSVVTASFRRTLHPFGTGKGSRRKVK